jgi:serine/threonine protein kinase
MAPELLDNKQYSIKVDVYSFSICLWEICSRRTPYNELSSPMAIIKHVTLEKKRPNLNAIPNDCPPGLIELMKTCWSDEPSQRPSFEQIIEYLNRL